MKRAILFLSLALLLCACDSDSDRRQDSEPAPTSTTITFANTSDYYANIYLDGVKLFGLRDATSKSYDLHNCNDAYVVKITLHEYSAADKSTYKLAVKTGWEDTQRFSPYYTYKVIITNNKATSHATAK